MKELRQSAKKGGAESVAKGVDRIYTLSDDLARLVAVWPELPGACRVAVLRLVDNAEMWAA